MKRGQNKFDPLHGDPDWIRTNDPQLRRLMLYPTELPDLVRKIPDFGLQIYTNIYFKFKK